MEPETCPSNLCGFIMRKVGYLVIAIFFLPHAVTVPDLPDLGLESIGRFRSFQSEREKLSICIEFSKEMLAKKKLCSRLYIKLL